MSSDCYKHRDAWLVRVNFATIRRALWSPVKTLCAVVDIMYETSRDICAVKGECQEIMIKCPCNKYFETLQKCAIKSIVNNVVMGHSSRNRDSKDCNFNPHCALISKNKNINSTKNLQFHFFLISNVTKLDPFFENRFVCFADFQNIRSPLYISFK